MKRFLFFIILLNSILVSAQFDPILIDTVSSHFCNDDLYKSYKKKFEITDKNISTLNSNQRTIVKEIYSEAQNDFLEAITNNNFFCDTIVNPYASVLFNEVLIKNSLNPADYKLILSRDSEINASNRGDGTVILNFGLFLGIENEDELAFVMSHEIAHQYLNHVKKGIENFAKISTSDEIIKKTKEIKSRKYGKATTAIDLLKSLKYENYKKRRLKEIEADSLGLKFYQKTLRNSKAAISLLEKLDVSDIEKDSLTVDDYKNIFEEKGFKIKEKYFLQEESLFKKYDTEKQVIIDSLKSHPDCSTRIKLITKYLNQKKIDDKVTNSMTFYKIKKFSKNQNLLNLFSCRHYGISLYEALKLYKNDKNNTFYKQIIVLNLKEIKKARINYTINRYVPSHDFKSNTTSLNRFISFITNIKITDFDTLITNFNQ